MNIEILRRAYEAIGETTPMKTDCGALCSAACCAVDEDGQGGVCLLNPEKEALQGISWGKIDFEPMMNAPMLMCSGMCDRELRPFLCRIFPLTPVIGKSGKWTVRMDARSRAVCPLSNAGLNGLDPDFVRSIFLNPQPSAQQALDEAFQTYGPDATVIAMPFGGATLPMFG